MKCFSLTETHTLSLCLSLSLSVCSSLSPSERQSEAKLSDVKRPASTPYLARSGRSLPLALKCPGPPKTPIIKVK